MSAPASPANSATLLDRVGVWPVRVLWLSTPFLCGPTFARALDGRVASFETGASIALWIVWGLVLAATLVPRPATLTAVRIVMPASVVAVAWAALADGGDPDAITVAGVAVAMMATVAAFLPTTGRAFVDGSSYGDERRLPLRPPGTLLLGPIELAWAAAVAGGAAGPLLLLAQQWVAGAVALVLGLPVAALATRALHGLARRWVVFVPAGLVLHDTMALADPVLFARRSVTRLGAAPADTDALDLTLGALGLALELRVDPPVPLGAGRMLRGGDEAGARDAVLFTPSQPGEVLREARARRFRVG
jgi:hypothetical protein